MDLGEHIPGETELREHRADRLIFHFCYSCYAQHSCTSQYVCVRDVLLIHFRCFYVQMLFARNSLLLITLAYI